MSELVVVKAPHYVATLIIANDVCTEAAPILRWAKGKPWKFLQRYFNGKGFEVSVMPDPAVKP
jgi:hypothetical protein